MFENLCSGLRWSISKDVMCLLNQTALSLPSKPLLKIYCSLWLAALSRCECMCLNLPVKLWEDTSYLMSPYHIKMLIVGRCASLSYTVLYRKAGGWEEGARKCSRGSTHGPLLKVWNTQTDIQRFFWVRERICRHEQAGYESPWALNLIKFKEL